MKSKRLVFLVSFLMALSCLYIEAAETDPLDVEISVGETFVSRYIWRGQDLYGDNDAAHQPYIDFVFPGFALGADLGINLWSSFPMSRGHEDGEEFDYTVSLVRTYMDNLDASIGYTYFDFPNSGSTTDVSESWVSFTLNSIIPDLPFEIAANIFAGYDFQATSGGPEEGWYYSWGFSTDLDLPESALTQEEQSLSIGVTNWGNDGVAGLEPSKLYATDISLTTSYSLGKLSISPSLNFSINHEDKINNGDDEFWTGIEFSYVF
ncbi:hypothetical protein ACFL2J_01715 [Candidatus Omnitrophota bacterium]